MVAYPFPGVEGGPVVAPPPGGRLLVVTAHTSSLRPSYLCHYNDFLPFITIHAQQPVHLAVLLDGWGCIIRPNHAAEQSEEQDAVWWLTPFPMLPLLNACQIVMHNGAPPCCGACSMLPTMAVLLLATPSPPRTACNLALKLGSSVSNARVQHAFCCWPVSAVVLLQVRAMLAVPYFEKVSAAAVTVILAVRWHTAWCRACTSQQASQQNVHSCASRRTTAEGNGPSQSCSVSHQRCCLCQS